LLRRGTGVQESPGWRNRSLIIILINVSSI
jgi:hypothetical protein